MMPVGGVIDLPEAPAEGNLSLRIELQAAEDQNSVLLQGIKDGLTDRVVGSHAGQLQAGVFGAHGLGELGDGEQTHGLSFLRMDHGTGAPVRIMTASAALTGAG